MPHKAAFQLTPSDQSAWISAWQQIFCSPVLWGTAATFAFYQAIPFLPRYREAAERYFGGHPLEYALVGLFLIGTAIISGRLLRVVRERQALALDLLEAISPPDVTEHDSAEQAEALVDALNSLPAKYRRTALVARFRETCDFLMARSSARGLDEHLKYLAETAAERLQDSYSLLLTINWAVPIIGFLGTVIGITLAIANVTPEQLDTSLNNVTGGLAVAFDTTTVALSFSLVLVFAYNWVKQSEQRILSRVEEISLQRLLPLFLGEDHAADPIQQAQADAAKQLLNRTETLIRDQTTLWRDSMDGLRERWSVTVDSQQQQLSESLHQGVESTLSEHAGQLAQVRHDFLSAFESAATQFQEALEFDATRRDQQEAQSQSQQQQLWAHIQDGLQNIVRAHDAHQEDLLDGLTERMHQWQSALEDSSQSIETHLLSLNEYASQLARLSNQGEQLGRVEQQLSDNLLAVRAAETFDETLHNLTAAVHMLTARTKPKAA